KDNHETNKTVYDRRVAGRGEEVQFQRGGRQDNRHRIVEDTFAEDQHVENGIEVAGMENGQYGNRVHWKISEIHRIPVADPLLTGGNQRSECETFGKAQSIGDISHPKHVDAAADDESRNGGADDGKHEDRANVLEKVYFVKGV